MSSNSILILLHGKEGNFSSLQAPCPHCRGREMTGKGCSPRRKGVPRQQELYKQTRTQRRAGLVGKVHKAGQSQDRPAKDRGCTATGSPWQCDHASWPCAHSHWPGPGCLPHGTCSAFAVKHPALFLALQGPLEMGVKRDYQLILPLPRPPLHCLTVKSYLRLGGQRPSLSVLAPLLGTGLGLL